jgi:hypothetical protein
MNKSMIIASGAAFIVSGSVFAQDIPDPNPIANPDGTMTWYTGNNTQYPVIQEVIDACTDGDEIVVMAGLYTESLSLNRNDITLRCATASAAAALADVTRAESSWQSVTFWNPTEGFDNNNDHAILLGANTTNTYVGRPRMFSQLSNGSIVFNEMPVSNTAGNEEWDADQEMIEVCQEIGGAGAANVAADIFQEGMEAGVVIAGDADHAMIFWSRSIDDVAVRSAGSAATLSFCTITSQNGFGGGIIVDGAGDSSSYVGCNIRNTFSGGNHSTGHIVTGCTIAGGHPMFAGCFFGGAAAGMENQGGAFGVFAHTGGEATFNGCNISNNASPLSDGLYKATGGAHATFSSCTIANNTSRFGTVYFDSTACSSTDYMTFTDCLFTTNTTAGTANPGTNWGSVAYCVDAVAGRSPMVVLDRCVMNNANIGTITGNTWWETDVQSNYFPRVRLLRDSSSNAFEQQNNPAGITGAVASGGDLNVITGDVNNDGTVDGMDLAALLANWS